MHTRTLLGREGEAFVASYLESLGFTILARNYTKPYGEVDLIASNNEYLVFVEVKTRKTALFDQTEVIQRSKQKKMLAVAKEFLMRHTHEDKVYRFDVAIVEGTIDKPSLTYIQDAFGE